MSYVVPREFTIDFRRVEGLDATVALSMASEGIGAALYLFSNWLQTRVGMLAGLALVASGALTLFFHLGHPFKFWRVLARSSSAWISRGAVATAAFLAFGVLSLVSTDYPFLSIPFETLAFVGGMAILLYSGLILSSMQAVPFFNSAIIPVILLLQSLASASLLCMLVLLFEVGRAGAGVAMVPVSAGLLLTVAALMLVLVKSVPRAAAAERAMASLVKGPLRRPFMIGSLILGILAPLAAVVSYSLTVPSHRTPALVTTAVGALSRCIGDVSFRSAVMKAGMHEPLVRQDER